MSDGKDLEAKHEAVADAIGVPWTDDLRSVDE
jgi:hypothetical protein